jgi:[ribosomal protein S18]-alanine N-acetyltransferase
MGAHPKVRALNHSVSSTIGPTTLISFATLKDVDAVYLVAQKSFASPWARDSFEQDVLRPWTSIRVIRTSPKGQICGFSHIWLVGEEAQLQHLAVLPEKRCLGYGGALLRDATQLARERGAKEVWLEVRRSNQSALHLYYTHGFQPTGVRSRYYTDNDEDAIVAKLVL